MLPITRQTRGCAEVVVSNSVPHAESEVGSEGFEPSPCGLKDRCAAVDTTTPMGIEVESAFMSKVRFHFFVSLS